MDNQITKRGLAIDNAEEQAKQIFDLLDVSEATRTDYKYRIGLFLNFIKDGGFDFNSFLNFKRQLAERTDITVATKNKYLATAKIFLKELNRMGQLPADITQNIKTFQQDKKHKREGINDEEMAILLDKVANLLETAKNKRLRAILALLTLQGLRQIEIIRLDFKDIDFVNKTALILGKGRDDKELINLHPATIEALREYTKSNKIADGALFVSQSNNNKNNRLTTRALRGMVKDFLHALDIDKTTHGFRHYFTTTLIKNYKGELLEVARYTRHRSIEMLQVYNDNINRQADLPRYYKAFESVKF